MAAKTVTIEEAEGHLDELIEKANAGDEVILSKGGEAVAKIVLLAKGKAETKQRRSWGGYEGLVRMSEDFAAPLADEFWLGETHSSS